jgi:hypothetical protein
VRLDFASVRVPTILYFFSSRCGWCERNWNSVAALEVATRGGYRFAAVTTEDGERRDRARGLPVPTYWSLSERDRAAYKLSSTPHTLVVSPDGRVLASWAGAYTGATREKVERYFEMQLPELPRAVARKAE